MRSGGARLAIHVGWKEQRSLSGRPGSAPEDGSRCVFPQQAGAPVCRSPARRGSFGGRRQRDEVGLAGFHAVAFAPSRARADFPARTGLDEVMRSEAS